MPSNNLSDLEKGAHFFTTSSDEASPNFQSPQSVNSSGSPANHEVFFFADTNSRAGKSRQAPPPSAPVLNHNAEAIHFSFSGDIEHELTSGVSELADGSNEDWQKGISVSGEDEIPVSELNISGSGSGNFSRQRSGSIISKVKRSISMSGGSKSSSSVNICGPVANSAPRPRTRTLKKTNSVRGSYRDRLEEHRDTEDDDALILGTISSMTIGHC